MAIPTTDATQSTLTMLLVAILSLEYFLGGVPRVSAFPLERMHIRMHQRTLETAPHLAPVFPFTDTRSNKTVRWHMRVVGSLMILEGLLLAMPRTRANSITFVLGLFLPAAGVWSQMKAGLPYWLPVINFTLGLYVQYTSL